MGPSSSGSLDTFKALKTICVPLLANSRLSPETIPRASSLLSQLSSLLDDILESETTISPSTIEYVFFPLSHILQRNSTSAIPDVIMEKLMSVLAALFEQWWWSCQIEIWEQVLMLSAAIFSGIDTSPDPKGKRKDRDDETKRAAAQCLWAVLRRRERHQATTSSNRTVSDAEERFSTFQSRGRASKLLPILGQTLTSLLETSQSSNRRLQDVSLHIIYLLVTDYLTEEFIPSILPGTVSAMAKVALGQQAGKGWSRGDAVDEALAILQATIVAAVGDEICEAEGALRSVTRLEDLGQVLESNGQPRPVASTGASPFFTPRTSVWLAATASQLHMVINTLPPLLSHPNPVALLSLSRFSFDLLSKTSRTLPDTLPLLLSFLLSLSTNQSPEVAASSHAHLLTLLLPPSTAHFTHLQILSQLTRNNLISLPRLLPSQSDAKVEHLARQVFAACQLSGSVHAVSEGVGMLLGPTGGIEKWGWSLLSVVEFMVPQLFVSTVQPAQALLEGESLEGPTYNFPEVNMKHVSSQSTREALDDMFRALGAAAGTDCLFAVEWFVGVAKQGKTSREVGALWCAGRILEGVCGISMESTDMLGRTVPKGVEKVSRWIAKLIAEFWDEDEDEDEDAAAYNNPSLHMSESDAHLPLEYVKGLNPLVTRFDLNSSHKPTEPPLQSQRILHKVLSLQLLSITAGILRSRFMRLLLRTLYPVLHSLVSQSSYVSSTALAALHYITSATGYASPSNLLLANFDYALDGVARRLDRRQLDPEAAKVLVVLVRLVGKDIVSRAGDVVEACFDRLDEFHGYVSLVEGLIEVLAEVVKVVEADNEASTGPADNDHLNSKAPEDHVESFLEWYQHRNDPIAQDTEDYGPAPREDWGNLVGKGKGKEVDEATVPATDVVNEPPPTPTQALTQQIVSRSIYFLTHPSPLIRARILSLLDTACPILSESALLPSIHAAWPYVLNRLGDSEPYVVSAAASLIASLAENVGEFMTTRVWNDVWPRFRAMLSKLEEADAHSALARRGLGAVGTQSAYSHSHRLYVSILRTMRAVVKGVQVRSDVLWELLIALRRFLHSGAHQELQHCVREVYVTLMKENGDVVWLILSATMGKDVFGVADTTLHSVVFLREQKWNIEANARIILGKM
ncbi:armadillo-type protein [Gautieria morchelliformis]|nr:armadillo-type protein [Gautieria morchelliformis]